MSWRGGQPKNTFQKPPVEIKLLVAMKILAAFIIFPVLFVLTSCKSETEKRNEAEFAKKWAVAQELIFARDYQRSAAVFGLNIHNSFERRVFHTIVGRNMAQQDRARALIWSWSEDDTDPTPEVYLDGPAVRKAHKLYGNY